MRILTARGIDFDAYLAYFTSIRHRLPPRVAAFAADPRHYSLHDRESLHDAWLESVRVSEPGADSHREIRACEIELHLLGAFHDRRHILRYTGVRQYELVGNHVTSGHGDVMTHEVRLTLDGQPLVHEIVFGGVEGSRLLVECADFSHEMTAIS